MTKSNVEFVSNVRAMADWYEQHPDIQTPLDFRVLHFHQDETIELAKRIARACGTFEKTGDDTFLRITKSFGALKLQFVLYRAGICHKRVIRTETVVEELPDPAAVAALPKIGRSIVREIVEWDCPPLLDTEAAA